MQQRRRVCAATAAGSRSAKGMCRGDCGGWPRTEHAVSGLVNEAGRSPGDQAWRLQRSTGEEWSRRWRCGLCVQTGGGPTPCRSWHRCCCCRRVFRQRQGQAVQHTGSQVLVGVSLCGRARRLPFAKRATLRRPINGCGISSHFPNCYVPWGRNNSMVGGGPARLDDIGHNDRRVV